jgi:hypothetical protein
MAEALDDRGLAKGDRPGEGPAPSPPTVVNRGLAVGEDWIGVGRGQRWRAIRLSEVVAVAVVPASGVRQWLFSRSLYAPGPDLVVRDNHGQVIEVDVRRVTPPIRETFLRGLTSESGYSPIAYDFLRNGRLPGRYGKSFGWGSTRFGSTRDQ